MFDPATGATAHRPSFQNRSHYGFGNALLLTGDRRYADLWGRIIDIVNSNSREIDGQTMYPQSYGDEGWYNYTADRFSPGALEVYYWSMDRQDMGRVPESDWIAFLEGKNPNYPVNALRQDFAMLREKMEEMRKDEATPDTRMSDDPNRINPAATENLTQLMLAGLPTGRVGYPLHCRLRYFDPNRRRAGIPEDVAALVDKMTDDEVAVTLVNINQVEDRTVIVQGGAYAEHRLITATAGETVVSLDRSSFTVRLAPGCGSRVAIKMERYANQPTFAFPWV